MAFFEDYEKYVKPEVDKMKPPAPDPDDLFKIEEEQDQNSMQDPPADPKPAGLSLSQDDINAIAAAMAQLMKPQEGG